VIGLRVEDLRRLDAETWLYALGATKTDTGGVRREKPLQGPAAHALNNWAGHRMLLFPRSTIAASNPFT